MVPIPTSRRAREIFEHALDFEDPCAARAYVAQECFADEPLRRRVEELLQANPAAEVLLSDSPAVPLSSPSGETPGDHVGRYKILAKIGEGGCGNVYQAEQERPLRRHVALKILKAGMDTAHVITRFEAERQALALMDHPNIAKVFDAGSTDTGRPYFVMELVEGKKITDYCSEHQLSVKESLLLFLQVCDAVQHAHQKGIIHRDLKPSNILIQSSSTPPDKTPASRTPYSGIPKVIDFGIAKAVQGKLTDATIHTGLHQFLGTPAYMSPEQADLSPDIDTRTDIYSLGVLLYELLTGRPPFNNHELLTEGLDEMRRIIREVEPKRPSHLSLTTSHLSVPSDLDWIVMKCLEKDRSRRYETVKSLSDDVRRYLNHEPIEARPPTVRYRLGAFVRRNRLIVAAAACVVFALLSGICATTWQAIRAGRAEIEMSRQRDLAEQRLGTTTELLNAAFERVSPALADVIGVSHAREELTKAASAIVDQARAGAETSPKLKRALAQLYTELAYMQGWYIGNVIGDFPAGLRSARAAIELLTPTSLGPPDDDSANRLARAEMMAGFACWGLWRTDEAIRHFERMGNWGKHLAKSANAQYQSRGRRLEGWARGCIGDTLLRSGEAQRALKEYYLPILAEAQKANMTLEEARSADIWDVWDVRAVHESVGLAYYALENTEEALPHLEQALGFISVIDQRRPDHAQFASTLAETHSELGEVLLAMRRFSEGQSHFARATEMADNLIRRDAYNHGFTALKIGILRRRAMGLAKSIVDAPLTQSARAQTLSDAQAFLDQAEILVRGLKIEPLKSALRPDLDRVHTRLRNLMDRSGSRPP